MRTILVPQILARLYVQREQRISVVDDEHTTIHHRCLREN